MRGQTSAKAYANGVIAPISFAMLLGSVTFLVIGKWSARRPAAGPPLEATSRAMLPYLAVLIVGVLVVAFVPWFTLAVPRLIRES